MADHEDPSRHEVDLAPAYEPPSFVVLGKVDELTQLIASTDTG